MNEHEGGLKVYPAPPLSIEGYNIHMETIDHHLLSIQSSDWIIGDCKVQYFHFCIVSILV